MKIINFAEGGGGKVVIHKKWIMCWVFFNPSLRVFPIQIYVGINKIPNIFFLCTIIVPQEPYVLSRACSPVPWSLLQVCAKTIQIICIMKLLPRERWDHLSIFKSQSNISVTTNRQPMNKYMRIKPSIFSNQWFFIWFNLEFGNSLNVIPKVLRWLSSGSLTVIKVLH